MESLLGTYVSCIKIGNEPIIPPLLDEHKRQEMRYYRQLAISMQNRTKPKNMSGDTGATTSSSESLPTEKELVKSDPVKYVKPIDLDVSESDHLDADDSESCISHEPSDSFTLADGNGFEQSDSFSMAEENTSDTRTRSNSYTLETPSPVLLAFIRSLQDKQGSDDRMQDIFVDDRTVAEPSTSKSNQSETSPRTGSPKEKLTRRKLWDIHLPLSSTGKPPQHSVSLPNSHHVSPTKTVKRSCESDDGLIYRDNYLSSEDREYIEKIEQQSAQHDSNTSVDIALTTKCDNDSFAKDFNLLDISVLSRDTDMGRESTFSDCSSVSLNKFIPAFDTKPADCNEAEQEAFLYFKEQLKLKHRQQLQLLLQEQQHEHDVLKEQFQKISRASSCGKSSTPSTPSGALAHHTYTKKSPNPRRSLILDDTVPVQLPIPKSSSSPKKKPTSGVDQTRHKAASKIQAGVRSYLTRRLFKTSRVIMLVQTIKDCLVTAVSLQNETNLGLSELDLQNRLLQQLTTACNELNDIFSLPASERMAVISEDREKKKRESRRTHTPLPLSDATRRSLQRKLTSSLPPAERKPFRKRCKSASSVRSDTSTVSTPPSQRRPLTASFSHKYSVPQSNRKPWR